MSMGIRSLVAPAAVLGGLALALAGAPRAAAQTTYTWTAAASGNFSTAANWQNNAAPPAGGDPTGTLVFTGGTLYTATNDLGAPGPAPNVFHIHAINIVSAPVTVASSGTNAIE